MEPQKKKILIIDDDRKYLQTLKDLLSEEGYYVIAAYSTEGAIDWALRKDLTPIDMIITDQRMPGEQGSSFLDFLNELREVSPQKLDQRSELYQKIRKRFLDLNDREFQELIKNIGSPSCKRVILSGYAEDNKIRESMNKRSIDKFIQKQAGAEGVVTEIRSLFQGG